MITPQAADQTRSKPYILVPFATALIGTLGSLLGGPIASIIGGIVGLGWGIGVGILSAWLIRRWPNISRHWLFVGAFIAATLWRLRTGVGSSWLRPIALTSMLDRLSGST
jgi:hypothetical protein